MMVGWSLAMHAVAMLTVFGVAAILGTAWPLAIGASLSLFGVLVAARARWGLSGRWSAANAVTALRLGLTLGVLALHGYLWHWLSVTVLVVAFALAVHARPQAPQLLALLVVTWLVLGTWYWWTTNLHWLDALRHVALNVTSVVI